MSKKPFRPIISVDFDGVIHSYTSGWKGASSIPDPPVPGAIEWLVKNADQFRLAIFSTRSRHPLGRWAMKRWLRAALIEYWWKLPADQQEPSMDCEGESRDWADQIMRKLSFPWFKPPAFLTIDDRALTFSGQWADYSPETILAFKPWNKKGRS